MNYFLFKTRCELIIVSDEIDVDIITEKLGITPDRFFRKGEQTVSEHSGSIIVRNRNLWAIGTMFSESKNQTISHHIEFFKSMLLPKLGIVQQFKKDPLFEVTFWVWIETDDAGIGLDIQNDELEFLNNIANTVHFTLLCKDNL